jgi:hypothetical protein
MSDRLNFATILATLTPLDDSISPIQYKADSTLDEEEFLSDAQPAKERGRRFVGNDGKTSTTIKRFASNGTRDFQVFDGAIADQLISWAQRNPTVDFDFDFSYQREEQDESSVRIQRHINCFFENTPIRTLSNDIAVVKFTVNYEQLALIDSSTGQPV